MTKNPENELHLEKYIALTDRSIRCDNRAPHIAVKNGDTWTVYQGCCNSWNCSRCGYIRASTEYHRILSHSSALTNAGHNLAFVTITAPGTGEITAHEADAVWYSSTTKFLNSYRKHVQRGGEHWTYVCVTERQKRGHPHAHYLMTCVPSDTHLSGPGAYDLAKIASSDERLRSDWMSKQLERSGLGKIYDIQEVDDTNRVVAYISKYLFKSLQNEFWPKGWRRVRYARNWPKTPKNAAEDAFPLLSGEDWRRLGGLGQKVYTRDPVVFEDNFSTYAPNLKLRRTEKNS